MGRTCSRAAALLFSAFAATALSGLAASPAHAASADTDAADAESSASSPELLGGLVGGGGPAGDGGLVNIFIGNYQVRN
ncbi:hypothetical protein [Nocardiopsis nanhaiensis]